MVNFLELSVKLLQRFELTSVDLDHTMIMGVDRLGWWSRDGWQHGWIGSDGGRGMGGSMGGSAQMVVAGWVAAWVDRLRWWSRDGWQHRRCSMLDMNGLFHLALHSVLFSV